MEEIKKGIYRHFKGNEYRVLGQGKDSETLEEVVIYHEINDENKIWVRPLKMFNEKINVNGTNLTRFSLIQEEVLYKVAVAYDKDNGGVYYHFGHCPLFKIYEISDNKNIINEYDLNTSGLHGPEIIDVLLENDIDVLIVDGIGPHPYEYGKDAGMRIITGIKGLSKEVVDKYINGKLKNDPSGIRPCGECEH